MERRRSAKVLLFTFCYQEGSNWGTVNRSSMTYRSALHCGVMSDTVTRRGSRPAAAGATIRAADTTTLSRLGQQSDSGYWREEDGRNSYGVHREFGVAAPHTSKHPLLKKFLAQTARDLKEECLYVRIGGIASLIYPGD